MTDKQKAKAYDEALERARKQKYDYQKELDKTDKNSQLAGMLRAGISAIELAFPELAESEDERIRKEIIEHLVKEVGLYPGEDRKEHKWLRWLEKQKEPIDPFDTKLFQDGVKEGRRLEREEMKKGPELTEELKKWKKDFDRLRKEHYGPKSSAWESPIMTHEMIMEKQKEQGHPCDSAQFEEGFKTGLELGLRKKKEQKSAEWSEDDEKMLNRIINDYENGDEYWFKAQCSTPFRPKISWLKSLPERFNLQPKQEWSEEDEKRVKQLIYDTEHIRAEYEKRKKELGESFNDELIKDCDEQIAWLKSRLPQPHTVSIKDATKFGNLEYERGVKDGIQSEKSRQWKPSEEQILAIVEALKYLPNNKDEWMILNTLVDVLKKLM